MINVGFIGAGNMGYAIMKGIKGNEYMNNNISLSAFDSFSPVMDRLNSLGVSKCECITEVVRKCKYVFLAVKPQQLDVVLSEVKASMNKDTVIISICAGITGDYIKSRTIPNARVILVMPNTPLLLGEGATAIAKVEPVAEYEYEVVRSIFAACGECVAISQDKMKEIIAINSSSPAFIYLFAKAFIDYAASVGIDAEVAKALFAKALIGSAKMITDSGKSIDELITMVSSKGGTTIAGLEKLREGNLSQTVQNCCEACTKRAYELSK